MTSQDNTEFQGMSIAESDGDFIHVEAPHKLQLTKEGQLDPVHLVRSEVGRDTSILYDGA